MPLEEKYSPKLEADIAETLESIPLRLRHRRLNTVDRVREIKKEIQAVVKSRGRQNIEVGIEEDDELLLRLWHPDYGDPEQRSSNWPKITIEPTRVSLAKIGQLQPPQTFTPYLDINYKVLHFQYEDWRYAFESVFRQAVENLGLLEIKPLKLSEPFTRINLAEVTGEEAIYFGQIPEAKQLLDQAINTRAGQLGKLQSQRQKLG